MIVIIKINQNESRIKEYDKIFPPCMLPQQKDK